MMIVVLPSTIFAILSWMIISLSGSSALVASSNSRMEGRRTKARAIASKSQLPRTRLNVVIIGALADAETGSPRQAISNLEAALTQARSKGYVAIEMEIQLALGVIQIRRDPSQARVRLAAQ